MEGNIGGQRIAMYMTGNLPRNPKDCSYLGFATNYKIIDNSKYTEFISLTGSSKEKYYFGRRLIGDWVKFTEGIKPGTFVTLDTHITFVHDVVP